MREAILCMKMNFQKWRIDPRIYVVAAGVFAFSYWTAGPLVELAEREEMRVSPWGLAFFFENPLMMTLYGCLVILLFANAPFMDRQTPFVVIRSGKGIWLIGQLLYVTVASFFYVMFWFLTSIIAVAQRLEWNPDWGELIIQITTGEIQTEGISLGLFPNPKVMNVFYGWSGAMVHLVLLWLIAIFMGCLLLFGNLCFGKTMGLVLGGVLTMLPLVTSTPYYVGLFGQSGFWYSPLCWCSLSSFSWEGNEKLPGIAYVFVILLTMMVVLSASSFCIFCKRDVDDSFSQ